MIKTGKTGLMKIGNTIYRGLYLLPKVKNALISVLSIVAPLQGTKLHTPKSNVKARANH